MQLQLPISRTCSGVFDALKIAEHGVFGQSFSNLFNKGQGIDQIHRRSTCGNQLPQLLKKCFVIHQPAPAAPTASLGHLEISDRSRLPLQQERCLP